MANNRIDHDTYFSLIAKCVALRSSCKSRNIGAVLVDVNNYILSTGYNGPAIGQNECDTCHRSGFGSGKNLNTCFAVHAEMNALLQCPDVNKIETLYVTTSPCWDCVKVLLNTNCNRIVFISEYPHEKSKDIWINSKRIWQQIDWNKLYDYRFISEVIC